ncbi:hypothetical protein O3M35_006484 [Rhynocoris fuscipes]|uniref:Uncharacterized protein n=1 Tax=Rhynocoris fuscipes TaxID=488301 RepID=A0AAW1DG36_9HEMI
MNVILLFGTCFIGEFLQEQSTLLYEEICRIPWHDLSPSIRRDILMMIIQSGKFMKIDFKGKLTLNLQTFMQVMNSAYSYFMVLNSSIS